MKYSKLLMKVFLYSFLITGMWCANAKAEFYDLWLDNPAFAKNMKEYNEKRVPQCQQYNFNCDDRRPKTYGNPPRDIPYYWQDNRIIYPPSRPFRQVQPHQ